MRTASLSLNTVVLVSAPCSLRPAVTCPAYPSAPRMVRNASRAAALVASLAALATQASAQSSCGGNYEAGDWCSDQPCGAGMQCYRDGRWYFYGGYDNRYPPCVRSGTNFCDSDDDDEEADDYLIIIIPSVVAFVVIGVIVFKVDMANERSRKTPQGTIPLTPSEAAVVTEALQGEWTTKEAVNLRHDMSVPGSASVTGLTYVVGSGTHGQSWSMQQSFKLFEAPGDGPDLPRHFRNDVRHRRLAAQPPNGWPSRRSWI